MSIEDKEVSFTIAQINELLAELGKIPYVHSAHLIAGIKSIAEPQVQPAVTITPAETETPAE